MESSHLFSVQILEVSSSERNRHDVDDINLHKKVNCMQIHSANFMRMGGEEQHLSGQTLVCIPQIL